MEVTNLLDIHTREDESQKALRRFVKDCYAGKMQPGWDDFVKVAEACG